jgi:predicted phosphodiesterase
VRAIIISDVHSNLVALDAVLRHADSFGAVDAVWTLGDNVGYGPQPAEVLARLREAGATVIAGNHDRAVTGAITVDDFNPPAAVAALWTRDTLSEDDRAYLDALPEVTTPADGFTIAHGTLRDPIWEYLYSYEAAQAHLALQQSPFSCVGHTHIPMLAVADENAPRGCELYSLGDGETIQLKEYGGRLVINPGSVGQPRDGDPRASCALYDGDEMTVTLHRVDYAIEETQKLMEEAELPRSLIDRLSIGR